MFFFPAQRLVRTSIRHAYSRLSIILSTDGVSCPLRRRVPGSSYVFDHLDRKHTSRSFLIQSERDSDVGVHEQEDLIELYYIQQAIRNQNDFFVDSDKNDSVKDAPLFEVIEGCATRTINQSVAAYILRKKTLCSCGK